MSQTKPCALCGRSFPTSELTAHHLIPKAMHGKRRVKKAYAPQELQQTVELCSLCHRHIHRLFSEKELLDFASLQALREDPRVVKWIQWRRKQKF